MGRYRQAIFIQCPDGEFYFFSGCILLFIGSDLYIQLFMAIYKNQPFTAGNLVMVE